MQTHEETALSRYRAVAWLVRTLPQGAARDRFCAAAGQALAEDFNEIEGLYGQIRKKAEAAERRAWHAERRARIFSGGIEYGHLCEVTQAYGGPEEGGWWYDVFEPVREVPPVALHEDASAEVRWAVRDYLFRRGAALGVKADPARPYYHTNGRPDVRVVWSPSPDPDSLYTPRPHYE